MLFFNFFINFKNETQSSNIHSCRLLQQLTFANLTNLQISNFNFYFYCSAQNEYIFGTKGILNQK